MKSVPLNQEDIHERKERISHEDVEKKLFSAGTLDDLAQQIKVKGKFNYGSEVAEKSIVDYCEGEIILDPVQDSAHEQEDGKIPQVRRHGRKKENGEARQKSDRRTQRSNIIQVIGRKVMFGAR